MKDVMESKEPKLNVLDLDFEKRFISYLESELSWNGIVVKMEKTGTDYSKHHKLDVGDFWTIGGTLAKKEITTACKYAGLSVNVTRIGDTTRKAEDVEYCVKVKGFDKNPIFHKLKAVNKSTHDRSEQTVLLGVR